MSSLDVTTTYPNHDLGFIRDEFSSAQRLTDEDRARLLKILEAAKQQDGFALFALTRLYKCRAWWTRERGAIVGSIDEAEIRRLEARGVVHNKAPFPEWRERRR